MRVEYEASEYGADGGFAAACYVVEGDTASGWRVTSSSGVDIELGPGYRLLRVESCGVCATDLARRFLPFPLPQVTGHEIVAVEGGDRYVVEINASHRARGLDTPCPYCDAGLPTHCPDRLTLGIDGLPGGFGPWVLAPVAAALPVPDSVPSDVAVLIEPFAAALHAVDLVAPRAGETAAVFGPGRLGMLVLAALRARRRQRGVDYSIRAIVRRGEMAARARALGAEETFLAGEAPLSDVVFDTTGSPDALARAVELARREIHLKSTHGRAAAGLDHLTELVVDEIGLARFDPDIDWSARAHPAGRAPHVAWCAAVPPPPALAGRVATVVRGRPADIAGAFGAAPLGRADVAVVDDAATTAAVLRPFPGEERSLLRPRGRILVAPSATAPTSPLLRAVLDRGLTLTSSRCGDFSEALALMSADPDLASLGDRLITHRFHPLDLEQAFEAAASPACLKAVVDATPRNVYHITTQRAWDEAVKQGRYRPPSLDTEGFIHCSTAAQLDETRSRWFGEADEDLVVLTIDADALGERLRWDPVAGRGRMPHLHEELDTRHVVGARPLV